MASAAAAAAATADMAASASAAGVAATATAAMTAAAPASAGELDGAADVFPVEEMEGGETDVGHFLFTENEALIG